MKPIINYTYRVKYTPTETFEFRRYNDTVDLTPYRDAILPKLSDAIQALVDNPSSRQVVINVNKPGFNTCLLTLQIQVYGGVIYLTGNYRSQCEVLGRPHDNLMLKYLATILSRTLEIRFVKITCNVGNYHISHLVS